MITIYDIAEVDNQTAQEAEIVDKYLQKIGLEDLLTPEDEQELLARAVEGDEEAADKVMRANLRFVVSLSNQYRNKGLSLLQLFEISMQGLANAIKASASRPNDERFIQFAVAYMRKAIEEALDEKKHSDRYFLQYKYIPDLVADVSTGDLPTDALLDTDWWKSCIELFENEDFYFEWDELHCDKIKVNDDYEMVVYTFPKPRQTPDAAYGAVLINTANSDATYYTLEYSFCERWMLCSMNQGTHRNYGEVENIGLENFMELVSKKVIDNK